MATPTARSRGTAADRREALIEAAIPAFGRGGLHGTPVSAITKAVGVTQPYAFSLFGTKRDLFLAAAERCFDDVEALFRRAAATLPADEDHPPEDRVHVLGEAYNELLLDGDALRFQLQVYAAAGADEEVAACGARRYRAIGELVAELTGADEDTIRVFLGQGMLCNLSRVLDLPELVPDEQPPSGA